VDDDSDPVSVNGSRPHVSSGLLEESTVSSDGGKKKGEHKHKHKSPHPDTTQDAEFPCSHPIWNAHFTHESSLGHC